eukprot:scaffold18865_cov57-Phaeocystis_antarctica.AAC.2
MPAPLSATPGSSHSTGRPGSRSSLRQTTLRLRLRLGVRAGVRVRVRVLARPRVRVRGRVRAAEYLEVGHGAAGERLQQRHPHRVPVRNGRGLRAVVEQRVDVPVREGGG